MKVKDGFFMTKLDENKYVILPIGEDAMKSKRAICTNSTGAYIWQVIQNGADTKEKVLDLLMKQYVNVDRDVVLKDLNRFLEVVSIALTE